MTALESLPVFPVLDAVAQGQADAMAHVHGLPRELIESVVATLAALLFDEQIDASDREAVRNAATGLMSLPHADVENAWLWIQASAASDQHGRAQAPASDLPSRLPDWEDQDQMVSVDGDSWLLDLDANEHAAEGTPAMTTPAPSHPTSAPSRPMPAWMNAPLKRRKITVQTSTDPAAAGRQAPVTDMSARIRSVFPGIEPMSVSMLEGLAMGVDLLTLSLIHNVSEPEVETTLERLAALKSINGQGEARLTALRRLLTDPEQLIADLSAPTQWVARNAASVGTVRELTEQYNKHHNEDRSPDQVRGLLRAIGRRFGLPQDCTAGEAHRLIAAHIPAPDGTSVHMRRPAPRNARPKRPTPVGRTRRTLIPGMEDRIHALPEAMRRIARTAATCSTVTELWLRHNEQYGTTWQSDQPIRKRLVELAPYLGLSQRSGPQEIFEALGGGSGG